MKLVQMLSTMKKFLSEGYSIENKTFLSLLNYIILVFVDSKHFHADKGSNHKNYKHFRLV
jgi:hypothetical protein